MTTETAACCDPRRWDEWYGKLERAFGGSSGPCGGAGPVARSDRDSSGRSAVWDGDEVVGTAGAFSFRMTVPGGAAVPAAGVTMVSVQPTHRRRGVLTAMMRRQLDDLRDGGEPLAVLTASEPAIYGRFGYGAATRQLRLEIDTARVGWTLPAGAATGAAAAGAAAEAVHGVRGGVRAAWCPERPGMLARQPGWERLPVMDPPGGRSGAGAAAVRAGRAGRRGHRVRALRGEAGVAGQRPDGHRAAARPGGAGPGDVRGAVALPVRHRPDVPAGWRATARSTTRCCTWSPTSAAAGSSASDALHVRLVEVGAALAARTYRTPVDVVLEVEDAFCPWNAGRWRLTGDAKGASCVRTTDPAELALSVRELATAYLGGFPLTRAGGGRPGRRAAAGCAVRGVGAFRCDVEPWLPHGSDGWSRGLPAHGFWQPGHQNRLRAARSAGADRRCRRPGRAARCAGRRRPRRRGRPRAAGGPSPPGCARGARCRSGWPHALAHQRRPGPPRSRPTAARVRSRPGR